MLEDEINGFLENIEVGHATLSQENTVQITLDGDSELFIDASMEKIVAIYLMAQVQHPSKQFYLRALALCDLRKILSLPTHTVADSDGRIGFMLTLPKEQADRDVLTLAFQQLLQTHMRFLNSI